MHAERVHSKSAVRHVVCFEEAGECTLERVAREARPGDSVHVFGPEAWGTTLRALGLAPEIPIARFARADNEWRRALASSGPDCATCTIGYGPRATRLAGRGAMPALMCEELPPSPQWPEGRRARIRRELGLRPHDRALLVAGEPSEWIDLSFVARAAGMAFVGGAPLRLVVSPRVPRLAEIDAFLTRATGFPSMTADARADTPWELLPALDGVVVDRDGAIERPVECAGWRRGDSRAEDWRVSPLPALWAIACGVPAIVHESIDLGARATHPRVKRFGRSVAALARMLA